MLIIAKLATSVLMSRWRSCPSCGFVNWSSEVAEERERERKSEGSEGSRCLLSF